MDAWVNITFCCDDVFFFPASPAGQMLIWRAYGLHGTALDEMKLRLKEWESSVHDDEEYVSELDS